MRIEYLLPVTVRPEAAVVVTIDPDPPVAPARAPVVHAWNAWRVRVAVRSLMWALRARSLGRAACRARVVVAVWWCVFPRRAQRERAWQVAKASVEAVARAGPSGAEPGAPA
jgi:hypothetical protein